MLTETHMKRLPLLGIASAALIAAAGIAKANLVTNGGFETGDFTGWVQSGDTSYTGVDGNPYSGVYGAYSGPVSGLGFHSQVLPTTAGTGYTISFFLSNGDDQFANE